ncbi:MAG: hypothetical protein V8Q30_12850 [Acutalibacteraceae bacterium]
MAYVIRSSFYQIDFVMGTESWVGLQNFRSIFSDADFLQAVGNTLIFTFFTVGIGISLALALAVFLNKNRAVYKPGAEHCLHPAHHLLYLHRGAVHVPDGPPDRYLQPGAGLLRTAAAQMVLSEETSLLSIIIVFVWKMLGYNIMIILAALQSVPGRCMRPPRWTGPDRSRPSSM